MRYMVYNHLPLEGGDNAEIADDVARLVTGARRRSRLREIATTVIVQATAKRLMERADRTKPRPTAEMSDISPGMQVDIWFDETNKEAEDQPRWRLFNMTKTPPRRDIKKGLWTEEWLISDHIKPMPFSLSLNDCNRTHNGPL